MANDNSRLGGQTMTDTNARDYKRADRLTTKQRMQMILQLKAANVSDKDIRKFAIQEYDISRSQATRLMQKTMSNLKELTSKNIEQLSLTILAKEFQALKEAEDMGTGNSQHDHRENIKLRLTILDKIREITDSDKYLHDKSEGKSGKMPELSSI